MENEGQARVSRTIPDPRKCPHRVEERAGQDAETARCDLLREISGVQDRKVLDGIRVALPVCLLCSLEEVPRPAAPNPTVASHLMRLLDEVVRRKGVKGCSLEKATSLRQWACRYLASIGDRSQLPTVPEYGGPCLHLSGRLPGGARPPRYRCLHELHDVTTLDACRRCPDYDQRLSCPGVHDWAVGVVTAPRRKPTLRRTLRSLASAGWTRPFVFADADTKVPARLVASDRLVKRPVRYYGWGNYYSALQELLLIAPHADAYLLIEDDVLFCRGLRKYLEATLWPAERVGFVSLHAAAHQDPQSGEGFYSSSYGASQWGSQAFVFPNASARMMVRHPWVVNHRSRGPRQGRADQDVVAGMWSAQAGLPIYMHTPSLTQHIGETSAIWGASSTLEGNRVAATFPGEEKDIRRVMAGLRAARTRLNGRPRARRP